MGQVGRLNKFSTRRLREGYTTAEVDVFRQELSDTFLGESSPSARQPKSARTEACVVLDYPWLAEARLRRAGGDSFLKMARLRLAAITPDNKFILYRAHARTRTATRGPFLAPLIGARSLAMQRPRGTVRHLYSLSAPPPRSH